MVPVLCYPRKPTVNPLMKSLHRKILLLILNGSILFDNYPFLSVRIRYFKMHLEVS